MCNKINYHYLILIAFLITSCGNTEEGNLKQIALGQNGEVVSNLTDLLDIKELTPLSMPDSVTFGVFERGISTGSQYIFNDGIYKGNFIIVDTLGNFINAFQKMGANPDEYSEVTSFALSDKNELIIHDYQKQRFTYYDLTGNYKSRINIAYNFRNFVFHNNYLYLFTAKHVNKVRNKLYQNDLLIVQGDSVIRGFLEFDPNNFQTTRIHNPRPFSFSSGTLFFSDMLSDTVYIVDKTELLPKYYFKYSGAPLPKELRLKGHESLAIKMTQDPNDLKQYDFLASVSAANSECLMYYYVHNMQVSYGVFDLSSETTKEFASNSFNPEYSKIFEPFTMDANGNFIAVVPLYSLKILVKEAKSNKQILPLAEKIQRLQKQITDPEHLIIVKYTIK